MRILPSVVVVIATYRRPVNVEECLAHLQKQTVRPDRIVVVDASPDTETRDLVARFPGVQYRRNGRGIGHTATSRAIGISGATEDIAAFIDDDAYAESDWLEKLLTAYDDQTAAAVGGRARNGQPDEEVRGVDEIGLLLPDGRLTGNFAADPGRIIEVDHLLGANMSVRLAAVRNLGGIRDLYPGTCLREETDIALRIRQAGMRILYVPDAVVRHVAGTYARGRRFDARYRYYAARNHVVLLATTLGWRDRRLLRYGGTVVSSAARNVLQGFASIVRRPTWAARVHGFAGGFRRSGLDLAGTAAGILAAVGATTAIGLRKHRLSGSVRRNHSTS